MIVEDAILFIPKSDYKLISAISQANYKTINEVVFNAWAGEYKRLVDTPNTVAVWKIKWKTKPAAQ